MFKSVHKILFAVALCAFVFSAQGLFAQDAFIGEIRMFTGNYAPRGWELCHGQTLPINRNQALFAILGTTFGGDGRNNFALPDLRGRFPMGFGDKIVVGEKGGTVDASKAPVSSKDPKVDLTTEKVVKAWNGVNDSATAEVPALKSLQTSSKTQDKTPATVDMPPYLAINYIICVEGGIFPARQ
jgi:microcystin-dependent protein